jgi:hypothetical protein
MQRLHSLEMIFIIVPSYEFKCDSYKHRISIPAFAIEQQWWQLGVPKNEMSLMALIYEMIVAL